MSLHAFEFACASHAERASVMRRLADFPFVVEVRPYTRADAGTGVAYGVAYVVDSEKTGHGDPHAAGSMVEHDLARFVEELRARAP